MPRGSKSLGEKVKVWHPESSMFISNFEMYNASYFRDAFKILLTNQAQSYVNWEPTTQTLFGLVMQPSSPTWGKW